MTGIPYARLIGPASIHNKYWEVSQNCRGPCQNNPFFRAVLGVQKFYFAFSWIFLFLLSFWFCCFLSTHVGVFNASILFKSISGNILSNLVLLTVDDPCKKQPPHPKNSTRDTQHGKIFWSRRYTGVTKAPPFKFWGIGRKVKFLGWV